MPYIDLRGIKVAKYSNDNGTTSYSEGTSIGDAMSVNLSLRRAEGRLYAESTLAEYLSEVVGGTVSIAEKYIPDAAQKLMYGARESSRTVNSKSVKGLKYGANDTGNEVGVAAYAPDMIDGVKKYTAFQVKRARFGVPDLNFQTKGESIAFQTPTTTGEFMPDHAENKDYLEVVTVDDEETAKAWVDAVLNITAAAARVNSVRTPAMTDSVLNLNTQAMPLEENEEPPAEAETQPAEENQEAEV